METLKEGDHVAAHCQTGGYSQFLTIDAALAVKVPDGVSSSRPVIDSVYRLEDAMIVHEKLTNGAMKVKGNIILGCE